jgi:hypothetical protein
MPQCCGGRSASARCALSLAPCSASQTSLVEEKPCHKAGIGAERCKEQLPRDPSSHHAERRSARQQAEGAATPFFDFSNSRVDPSGKSGVWPGPMRLNTRRQPSIIRHLGIYVPAGVGPSSV